MRSEKKNVEWKSVGVWRRMSCNVKRLSCVFFFILHLLNFPVSSLIKNDDEANNYVCICFISSPKAFMKSQRISIPCYRWKRTNINARMAFFSFQLIKAFDGFHADCVNFRMKPRSRKFGFHFANGVIGIWWREQAETRE